MKSKNTIFEVKFVDAHAFFEYFSTFDDVSKIEYKEPKYIEIVFSRMAYDEHGGNVGYEKYQVRWKLFKKKDLGIVGIPLSIFPYVVNPDNFEIVKIVGAIRNCARYYKSDKWFVEDHVMSDYLSDIYKNIPTADFDGKKWSVGNYEENI